MCWSFAHHIYLFSGYPVLVVTGFIVYQEFSSCLMGLLLVVGLAGLLSLLSAQSLAMSGAFMAAQFFF